MIHGRVYFALYLTLQLRSVSFTAKLIHHGVSRAGHIALERTLISGAKERFNKMSEERPANLQNPILSSSLMSDLRTNEQTDQSEILTDCRPYSCLQSEKILDQ